MKSFLLSLTFLLIRLVTFSQTTEHLTFKGIQIDGPLEEVVTKLKQNGFEQLATEGRTGFLKGDFAGYSNCTLLVSTLKQKNIVYSISVLFPDTDKWSVLSSNYSNLKEMLINKYGPPSAVIEKFDGYSDQLDDNLKIYEVKLDRCKYYCNWTTEKGVIQLTISHHGFKSCFVYLGYFDKTNKAIADKKAQEDL